jgi:ABC-type proline/glycine betaine transport system ATPase subunit
MNETSLNISIRDVTKKYDQFYALKDVSLEINSGEFMTLLGPSGSGKNYFADGFSRFYKSRLWECEIWR